MKMVALDLCIGHNMWFDKDTQLVMGEYYNKERDFVYFDRCAWDKIINELPALGVDTVILDLAEGIKYDCAPDLAIKGSIDKAEFKKMLDKLRALGITAIPKLDFSAAHDLWAGNYGKSAGTQLYRDFCKNIIDEVCELFGKPEYFHLGLADETIDYQRFYGTCVVRGPKAFWRDVYAMFDACRANGAKPIMYGDYFGYEPQAFTKMLPRDVVIAARYSERIQPAEDEMGRDMRSKSQLAFEKLCEFDNELLLVGSGLPTRQNITDLFYYAKNNPDKKIIGVMSCSELPTVDVFDYALLNEAMRLGKGKEYFDKNEF